MRLMLLLLAILVVSCNGLEDAELPQQNPIAEESESLPAPLSGEDFIVRSDNTIIELDMDYKELRTDEIITYARYADERYAYDTVIYENFMLSNGLKVFMFALTTDVYETSRGIKVGDNILHAIEKYGMGRIDKKTDYQFERYRYSNNAKDWYNRKAIEFYVDDNKKIIRIQFELDHA
jgi:hypothetical protein